MEGAWLRVGTGGSPAPSQSEGGSQSRPPVPPQETSVHGLDEGPSPARPALGAIPQQQLLLRGAEPGRGWGRGWSPWDRGGGASGSPAPTPGPAPGRWVLAEAGAGLGGHVAAGAEVHPG